MATTCSATQHSISGRRQQAQVYLCIALSLIALHHAHADTVTHEPGKIAVDPTSDEDASVELNQRTQLGATGTSSTNAYPTYADGSKVTSANLNRVSTPIATPASGGSTTGGQFSVSGADAVTRTTPEAAATTSTASSINTGTEQLIRSASTAPVLASTTSTGSTHATEGASQGGVTSVSGGSAGGPPASLTGFLSGGASAGTAATPSGSGLTAGGGGNSQKPASTASEGMTGRVTSVGGRKLKL